MKKDHKIDHFLFDFFKQLKICTKIESLKNTLLKNTKVLSFVLIHIVIRKCFVFRKIFIFQFIVAF